MAQPASSAEDRFLAPTARSWGRPSRSPSGRIDCRLKDVGIELLPLGNPGPSHALNDRRALRKIDRIVARDGGAETRDGELAVELQPYANLRPRLLHLADVRERR